MSPSIHTVEYQVAALRQVIAAASNHYPHFVGTRLGEVMKNVPRTGTNPIYEPLHIAACDKGLQVLMEDGTLTYGENGYWTIAQQ